MLEQLHTRHAKLITLFNTLTVLAILYMVGLGYFVAQFFL